jgi:transporter family protein
MQLSRGGDTTSSPKLTTWIGPALSSALSYALYNIFIKLGSASIHPVLGGVILQFVAALIGSCLLGVSRDNKLTFDRKGVLWSVCAGIFVGLAEILSFQVSGMGVEASKSIPIMIGGSVAFGSVLGFALLKERMTMKGWFGVLLVVLGVVCVATDPGAKLASH